MLIIDRSQEGRIRKAAEEAYPEECCGFLIGKAGNGVRTVTRIQESVNERTDSLRNRFLIGPQEMLRTERELREGESVLGFFHSHPDAPARPSEYDRTHAWPWYSYLIVAVRQGRSEELTNWRLQEDGSEFTLEKLDIRNK
jgi:proteasome lid subunit RPN8/RPN11